MLVLKQNWASRQSVYSTAWTYEDSGFDSRQGDCFCVLCVRTQISPAGSIINRGLVEWPLRCPVTYIYHLTGPDGIVIVTVRCPIVTVTCNTRWGYGDSRDFETFGHLKRKKTADRRRCRLVGASGGVWTEHMSRNVAELKGESGLIAGLAIGRAAAKWLFVTVLAPCQGSRCPEKSPRNNPEERGSQQLLCGSLKSRTAHVPVCAFSWPGTPLFLILDLFQIEVYFPPLPAAENFKGRNMESCKEHSCRSTRRVSDVSRARVGVVLPWCKCHCCR